MLYSRHSIPAALLMLDAAGSHCRAYYERWIIVLQWIPRHCGIKGNEEADRLAKECSQKEQPDVPLEYGTTKRALRRAMMVEVKRAH